MYCEALENSLGRASKDPLLANAFASVGVEVEDELELPDGEFVAYVERPAEGIAFAFKDEAFFHGLPNAPIGTGRLFFAGMFFYLSEQEEYTPYAASLPLGIAFTDDAETLAQRFGTPEWERMTENGNVLAQRWAVSAARRLHVTYSGDGSMVVLSYGVPDRAL